MSVTSRATRVLVVDDNSNAADALAAYLASDQQKVIAVYGGAAAIAATCVWKPDVVLLDISMPHIDGFAVAKVIRSSHQTSSAIVIALTALDEAFVKKNSKDFDFDAYCQKGLFLDSLTSLLLGLRGISENEDQEQPVRLVPVQTR